MRIPMRIGINYKILYYIITVKLLSLHIFIFFIKISYLRQIIYIST